MVEAEIAAQLAVDSGFPLYEALARQVNGWALVAQGHAEEGIRQTQQGLLATQRSE